jgi:hypothetical protein
MRFSFRERCHAPPFFKCPLDRRMLSGGWQRPIDVLSLVA